MSFIRKLFNWFSGKQKKDEQESKGASGSSQTKNRKNPPLLTHWSGSEGLSQLDNDQKSFYEFWLDEWQQGHHIDLKGNKEYLYAYIYEILDWSNKDQETRKKLINELKDLQKDYGHNSTFFGQTGTWIADTYIIDDKYKEAIKELRKVRDNCSYSVSKKLWTLLRYIRATPTGGDLLARYSNLTSYGKKNEEKVIKKLSQLLRNYEEAKGIKLALELVKSLGPKGEVIKLHLYRGISFEHRRKIELATYQPDDDKIRDLLEEKELRIKAENAVRKENDLPKIGEGWISEAKLKNIIKRLLKPHGYSVKYRNSPSWLGRQHLDIFVPELDLAIEYMGKQHYKPIEYFGGEESFDQLKQNDKRKIKKCEDNEIELIYFKYDETLELDYVADKISKYISLEADELIEKAADKKYEEDPPSYADEEVKNKLNSREAPKNKKTNHKEKKKKREKKLQKLKQLKKPKYKKAHLGRAELLRKLGRVKEAEKEYWKAIKQDKQKHPIPAPAPYRALAKLYYHTGHDEKALEVMDEYIESPRWKTEQGVTKNEEMKKIRKRMSSSKFHRFKNKYDDKPKGERPQNR